MVDPVYDQDALDRRVRRTLRSLATRGLSYVKVSRVQQELEGDVTRQAVNHSFLRLQDEGSLEEWKDRTRSTTENYRITLQCDCGRCGESHDSMAAAMECCDERFEDPQPIPGTRTIRGPDPALVNHLEGGESR